MTASVLCWCPECGYIIVRAVPLRSVLAGSRTACDHCSFVGGLRFEFYATEADAEQARVDLEVQKGPWLAELRESADRVIERTARRSRDRLEEVERQAWEWRENLEEEERRSAEEEAREYEALDAWAAGVAEVVEAQETLPAPDSASDEYWEFVQAFNHWRDES